MANRLPIDDLRSRITGDVFAPDDPGFAEEVAGFNTAAVQRPDVVVAATGTPDIAEAVRFAREHHLPVRVQSTGHGAFPIAISGVFVTTKRLDSVEIDPQKRVATIGAGVRWKAVTEAAAPHGLAPITGAAPNVGVVGYLVGGGVGPLARSHGFSSDYVRGFTVITGEGEIVTADERVNDDLFWALRGGKGGLGVVTEVRVELVPLDHVYGGALFFEEEQIEKVLRAWIDWTASAPEQVTTSVAIMRLPPIEAIPEPLRGKNVIALRFAYPGDTAEGEKLAAPLRAFAPVMMDTIGELKSTQLGLIHNDPDQPAAGWDRGMMLSTLDQDFATALLGVVGPGVQVPFILCEIRHLGGATARDVPGGSAVGGRGAPFSFILIGVPDPTLFDAVLPAASDGVVAAIAPWVSPETNINFAGRLRDPEHFASAWPADTFARLAEVRKRHDPDGVFAYGP